jgi:hypothetical protein
VHASVPVRTLSRLGRGTLFASLALAAVAALGLTSAATAAAQTYSVTNLTDSGVENDGSLRGEVKAANTNPGPDAVVFAPGLTGTITFAGVAILIDGPLDLEGPGPAAVTIQQTTAHRIFQVDDIGDEAVRVAGLHLADGQAPTTGPFAGDGGDVVNLGASLTLEADLITGGFAELGGGVWSYESPLAVRSSTVAENEGLEIGGVLAGGSGGSWSIVDSTIEGNETPSYVAGFFGEATVGTTGLLESTTVANNTALEGIGGGEVSARAGGSIVVRNSTFTGNTAVETIGGLSDLSNAGGSVLLEGTTIAGNFSAGNIGGLELSGATGTLSLLDTIVADNTAPEDPDVVNFNGTPTIDFSLIGDPSDVAFDESIPGSDVLGVSPRLGPLDDDGGPTETMALPPGSPAVNRGGSAIATTDQRGDARPVVYPGVALSSAPGADGSDIGAYELQLPPAAPTVAPLSPPPPPPTTVAPRKLQVRVTCPKSAKPGGCKFSLQVVSAKPRKVRGKGGHARTIKPTPESAVAVVKLGPGKSGLVTLTPKAKFATKLASAANLLVRQVEKVGGKAGTSYRLLSVVG